MKIYDAEDAIQYEMFIDLYDEEPHADIRSVRGEHSVMLRTLIPELTRSLKHPKSRIVSIDNDERKPLIISLFGYSK